MITIDRLTLKLSGISEHDGQHLARLITEELANSSISVEGVHHLETMRVNVATSAANSVDVLAKYIVADVLRQLERAL